MTNLILTLIVCSTVITSIIEAMKPGFKKLTGKYTVTVATLLSFLLWILASFSVAPYLWLELNSGLLLLLWMALGTGSNLFYDVWSLIKNASDKIRGIVEEEK